MTEYCEYCSWGKLWVYEYIWFQSWAEVSYPC